MPLHHPVLKVLLLASDAFGGTGGIAQYLRDLAGALASYRATSGVIVIPRVIARDVEPLPARVTHIASAAGSKRRFVAAAMRVAWNRPAPDLVVCGHINLLPIAYAASVLSGARLVLVTYGMEVWEPPGWLTRALMSRVHATISISAFTLDKMRQWAEISRLRAFLLPNAVDLSRYAHGPPNQELARRWGLTNKRVLLTLGRMDAAEQAKGFDEILDVLPQLVEEFPNIMYVAAGDGTDRRRLEAKARELGVADQTIFPGYVSEEEKPDFYRLASVFVMPSRLEGFGYVFLEALAAGVPVIASRVDGSREAVMNGSWGGIVDPAVPVELVAAIRKALLDPFVPHRSELEYFSGSQFEERCHAVLDAISQPKSPPPSGGKNS